MLSRTRSNKAQAVKYSRFRCTLFNSETTFLLIYGLGITLLIAYYYWLRKSAIAEQRIETTHQSILDQHANFIDSITPVLPGLPLGCNGYKLISGNVLTATRIFLAEKHNNFCKAARADCVNVLAAWRNDDTTNAVVLNEFAPYGYEILCQPDNMIRNCWGWNAPPQEWHALEVHIAKRDLITSLLYSITAAYERHENENTAMFIALQIFNETINSENHFLKTYLAVKNSEFNSLLNDKPMATKDMFYSSADRSIAESNFIITYLQKLLAYCEKSVTYQELIETLTLHGFDSYAKVELMEHNQHYLVTRPNSYLFKALKKVRNQTAFIHVGNRHIIKSPHLPDPTSELIANLDAEKDSNPYAVVLCSRSR